MTARARLLLVIAAGCLVSAIAFPLWEVRLLAPQYPEGLGLQILAYTVRGIKEFDLNNINGLNHYIGMKVIEPDAIPELRFMPWVIVGMAVLLLVMAWRRMRRALLPWLLAFAVLGGVGLWDFWRWEYDYGHNLNPETAIIVVPGMNYQPPLIGSKRLLNFTATAWPGSGALLLGLGALAVGGAWWSSRRDDEPTA